MTDRQPGRVPVCLSLLAALCAAPACGDDGKNDGGTGFSSGESGETAESTSAESNEGADNDQGDGDGDNGDGDGDGDPGDGDGDSGDGDGDGDPGDGDGDSGDGDGDSGDGDGDGDSGDGDGDGDGGDGDGDMACQEFAGEIAPIPPSVMLLLDRSGSMIDIGFDPQNPDKTRWQVLYESVEALVGNGADAQIAFGAKTFSTQGQGACGVSNNADVPIALNNADNILGMNGIPGPMVLVNGGTPTNTAIEKTMAIMQTFDAGDSDKIVFLITDGRIGCLEAQNLNLTDDEALAMAVEDLQDGLLNHDITTYVVAIAPTMFGPTLMQMQQMALAGGAPKPGPEAFYRADDAQQLSDALDAVLQDSYGKSCLLDLEEAPFFPDFTKVVIGMTEYELVQDCENEDGFIYTNMDFTQIEMCGAACADLAIEQSAEVNFYCDPG